MLYCISNDTIMNNNKLLKSKNLIVLSFLIVLMLQKVHSQNAVWFYQENFTKPFTSEMRSPAVRMELVKLNQMHPFYYLSDASKRIFVEVQTGVQLPILTFDKTFTSSNLKIAICTPVSIVTLVDMFESETAAVINNDYRFGISTFLLYTPAIQTQLIRNYHLTLVPMFHESTHIGDEFALHGYLTTPHFSRINVSYEAWQIFAGINRNPDELKQNLALEIGYQRLMPYKAGYYNIDSLEINGQEVLPSNNRSLWLFRAQYSYPFSIVKSNVTLTCSAELCRDFKYGYSIAEPGKNSWSLNSYVGIRVPIKNSQKHIGIYYRYYQGVMPYGQLRDKNGLRLNGISIAIL